jgi:acetamidase/formamidase
MIDFFSSRFYYTFGPHPPTLRVTPSAILRIVCPESDNELSDATLLPSDRRQADVEGLVQANPMAGPIFVEGAVPGDSLAVRVEAIELDRATGQTGLAPEHGVLPMQLLLGRADPMTTVPRHLFRWRIDVAERKAHLDNPLGKHEIEVPLDPFVGCIGVCPQSGQSISTLLAGPYGGNMDIPAVRPGATIYLPVFVEGGLLMMGDVHAAQGHGEIIGGAIETSGKIHCTINLMKNRALESPRIRDAKHLMAIGVANELRAAIQRAYANLLDWLVADFQMNRWDAYNLISQVGSIVVGGLGMPPYSVAAGIAIDALPDRAREMEQA